MSLTTVDIKKLRLVKEECKRKSTSLKSYINGLIARDVVVGWDEDLSKKYFRKEEKKEPDIWRKR